MNNYWIARKKLKEDIKNRANIVLPASISMEYAYMNCSATITMELQDYRNVSGTINMILENCNSHISYIHG